MGSEDREIIIQNNDPSIAYVGEWTIVQRSTVFILDGDTLISSPTLQSTKTNSSFSFPFEGSSIFVFATFNVSNTPDTSLTSQCIIDGIGQGVLIGLRIGDPWALCGQDSIPDGSHELVVNITSDGSTIFWVEYLAYSPSPDVSRENTLIAIDNTDPAINYISGWSGMPGYNHTTDPDGLVNVTFVGIQLSWYGVQLPLDPALGLTPSSGEYSVDGEPFISFQIPTEIPGTSIPLLFITRFLEMGTHVLSVRYTGSPGQISLTLEHLVVTNGSFSSTPPTISGGSTNGTGPSYPTTPSMESRNPKIGVIVGGAVGSIVGVAVVIAIFCACLKYYRRRREFEHLSPDVMPFHTQDRQSTLPETVQVPKNFAQQQPNVTSNDIVIVESSDSDSLAESNPFRTPIHTINSTSNFSNNFNCPPVTTNIPSNGTFSHRPLPAIPAVSIKPTANTDGFMY